MPSPNPAYADHELAASGGSSSEAPESRERRLARDRGAKREDTGGERASNSRRVESGRASASVAARAFSMLADSVRDYSIVLLDANGIITFWGEGARLIDGWTQDEAEGAHLRLLYPDGGAEDGTATAHLRIAIEQGQYSGEGRRVRRDESTFWASATLAALRDGTGELLGLATVTRDLTARRQAEALLTTAAQAAEAARESAVANASAKMEFLATVSHEIRTPVNAILGYHDLLKMELDGPLSGMQRSYVDRATASGRHLLSIIDQVLDFARLDADRVQVGRKAFRLGAVVAEALAVVAPQAHRRRIVITDASGGTAQELAAWGDASRVRQILVNLLSNAIKFTEPRDGTRGRLTVSVGAADAPPPDAQLSGEGPWAYVRVEDTGAGIPTDRLEAIFEPFVQADMTLTRRHGGTGLGLAISRRLARQMGGDLTARSEIGLGSTFLLWLPLAPMQAATESPDEDATIEAEHPPDELPPWPLAGHAPERAGALAEISDALLQELEQILRRYIARMREDPATPSAHATDGTRLEDHLATYVADLAATLANVAVPDRDTVETLRDSSAIQDTIARKHGAQRARLGWDAWEVAREFAIMEEELIDAIRRAAPRHLRAPSPRTRAEEVERTASVLRQFLAAARRLSLESHARAARELAESRA
jgi:PAS domain S-box-containing protein